MCCGSVQHNSNRDNFLVKLQDCLGDRYIDFEALGTMGKALFALGNEVLEEHLDSLLGLVKNFIISILEERKRRLYSENQCAQQPSPQSPAGDLGDIRGVGVQNGKLCVRKVRLTPIYCILICVYVGLHIHVGAWSKVIALGQLIECY